MESFEGGGGKQKSEFGIRTQDHPYRYERLEPQSLPSITLFVQQTMENQTGYPERGVWKSNPRPPVRAQMVRATAAA
jgi:hypothetical protein